MSQDYMSPGLTASEAPQYPKRVAADIQINRGRIQGRSLPEVMADEVGHYIICQMLIGTNKMVVFEGVLTQVGNDYFVLFNESTNSLTSCDMYSLKFVTFFNTDRPVRVTAPPQDVQLADNDICRWYENTAGSNGFRYIPLDDSTIGGSLPQRLREEGMFAQNQI